MSAKADLKLMSESGHKKFGTKVSFILVGSLLSMLIFNDRGL